MMSPEPGHEPICILMGWVFSVDVTRGAILSNLSFFSRYHTCGQNSTFPFPFPFPFHFPSPFPFRYYKDSDVPFIKTQRKLSRYFWMLRIIQLLFDWGRGGEGDDLGNQKEFTVLHGEYMFSFFLSIYFLRFFFSLYFLFVQLHSALFSPWAYS